MRNPGGCLAVPPRSAHGGAGLDRDQRFVQRLALGLGDHLGIEQAEQPAVGTAGCAAFRAVRSSCMGAVPRGW